MLADIYILIECLNVKTWTLTRTLEVSWIRSWLIPSKFKDLRENKNTRPQQNSDSFIRYLTFFSVQPHRCMRIHWWGIITGVIVFKTYTLKYFVLLSCYKLLSEAYWHLSRSFVTLQAFLSFWLSACWHHTSFSSPEPAWLQSSCQLCCTWSTYRLYSRCGPLTVSWLLFTGITIDLYK